MIKITTTANHRPSDFRFPSSAAIADMTARAATLALRRIGGEAVEWSRRSGSFIDTARLAFHRCPDARLFGRHNVGASGKPAIGIVTLIDSSGSMEVQAEPFGGIKAANMGNRRDVARAIACGMSRAAAALGLASIVGHHGANRAVEVSVSRTTRGALDGPCYGGNMDAWAVRQFVTEVDAPADRTILILVCDGAPNATEDDCAEVVAEASHAMARKNISFILAYIGDAGSKGKHGLERAQREWGAARVADCRGDMSALTAAMIKAVARAR